MTKDTQTIFEHWTDTALAEMLDAPEGTLEAGMLAGVKSEIARREKEAKRADEAHRALMEAKAKAQKIAEQQRRQKEAEQYRQELFRSDPMLPEVRERFTRQWQAYARQCYMYGDHAASFVLSALCMAMRDGKAEALVDRLRDTEYPERWSMSHTNDPNIIVYFDEVFPAKARA